MKKKVLKMIAIIVVLLASSSPVFAIENTVGTIDLVPMTTSYSPIVISFGRTLPVLMCSNELSFIVKPQDSGKTIVVTAAENKRFESFVTMLTNGVDNEFCFSFSWYGGGMSGGYESHFLEVSNGTGPDLVGFSIDSIGLVVESITSNTDGYIVDVKLIFNEMVRKPVDIDIQPKKYPNIIYPGIVDPKDYNGLILVSVLTTPNIDARTVDPTSVRFGPAGASAIQRRGIVKDVDFDGDLDITFAFRVMETGIKCWDSSASLNGSTLDGYPIKGSDSILTLGCGSNLDHAALLALYNSTNGEMWWNNSGWLTEPDHCQWYGIACDEAGRVHSVLLSWNGLTGMIPPELGYLQNLEYLDLYSNELSGHIPPELGNLNNLRYLALSFNRLTGLIPSELGALHNLNFLLLEGNQFNGPISHELGNLNDLLYLRLSYNQLSGSILPELGNLQLLYHLELEFNQFSGPIPPELGNLQNLQELNLSYNALSESIPPELGSLQNLYYLSMHDNQLSGPIPPELGSLQNLHTLWLSNNQLSGEIPLEMRNLQNIQSLYLYPGNSELLCISNMELWAFLESLSYNAYRGPGPCTPPPPPPYPYP